ncbi:tRNA (adenine-N(1)-)-methyltransferase catalytic subunit trm61 [Puccinia graminis f. sp. tritici]|uniref:tRNA (adenine(58)-N(1))-methyltransferase catalytic subunit TRM61 n=1 Tax=Puccinia graminis f. sp. tritici TaxID=56615 RepID=A0A5B0SH49_PUCGR|nr:tRNA (adenine-N(1)-)-methyltransferase catalytic subunit trm61 [Puccinia graminis f. sp. tritici]
MTQAEEVRPSSIFDIRSGTIQSGDTVIVYQSRDNLTAIVVTPGQQLNTRYGEFPHSDMIDIPFGSKCPSRKGNGFTYLLRPTPELWTLALPHRTQILYHPDISFVTSQLNIKPGSYVIEAGTGSGSFSHSIARTIGPGGKLFSFEFHEERHTKAAAEFQAHGLLSSVGGPIQLAHRNVIRDGFGDLDVKVDSVFLDLPAPWDALEESKRVMNRSQLSRICCFSPCIEQVQKTCQTLESLGFSDIIMFETLVRTHEPVSLTMPKVDDAVRRIKEVEMKKQARRERQISESKQRRQVAQKPSSPKPTSDERNTKRGLDGADATEEPELKKPREEKCNGSPVCAKSEEMDTVIVEDTKSVVTETDQALPEVQQTVMLETSKPAGMTRGHTSFLTFAVLLPLPKP